MDSSPLSIASSFFILFFPLAHLRMFEVKPHMEQIKREQEIGGGVGGTLVLFRSLEFWLFRMHT